MGAVFLLFGVGFILAFPPPARPSIVILCVRQRCDGTLALNFAARVELFLQDGIELATASADVAGLVSRVGGIEPIIRGASYTRSRAIDLSFAAEVSKSSPLFNLPVEVVQRGRDHGKHRGATSAGGGGGGREIGHPV